MAAWARAAGGRVDPGGVLAVPRLPPCAASVAFYGEANARRLVVGDLTPPEPRPGGACRRCGGAIAWRRDGVAFGDGSAMHVACHEQED